MADERPNIVFVLCDNVGWGDFSCYGGITATPRIDEFASEGVRCNNYTVEAQCTPSRSAILTGRQSVRTGTFKVPFPGEGKSGLVPWEYTIANLLSDAGYATSLWGKGISVTPRADSPPTRDSTSGGGIATAQTRAGGPPTPPSMRLPRPRASRSR